MHVPPGRQLPPRSPDLTNVKLVTHSGTFHADDVLAWVALSLAYGRHGASCSLERTRDARALDGADVVFDVGGVCDPARRRYDHHMRERPLREDGAPYSSAGLVWRDFGREAVRAVLGGAPAEAVVEEIWAEIDETLVRPVDLVDNGVVVPAATDLAAVVDAFNLTWDAATGGDRPAAEAAAFSAAGDVVTAFLMRRIDAARARLLAEERVLAAHAASADPRVLELPCGLPWIEAAHKHGLPVLFATYEEGGTWYLRCAPVSPESYTNKLDLPAGWAGLRDGDLARASGVGDALFCHPNRFIAGAGSREGLAQMLEQALEQALEPACPRREP